MRINEKVIHVHNTQNAYTCMYTSLYFLRLILDIAIDNMMNKIKEI